jgi:hypothetical protein
LGAARPLYPHFQRRGKVTVPASLAGFCEKPRMEATSRSILKAGFPADDCLIEQPYAVVYALSLCQGLGLSWN